MKAPWWQYLIPKYGNFGGPGWSGGAMMSNYDEVDWSVGPVDSLDECFHDHDRRYQSAIELYNKKEITEQEKCWKWIDADKILVKDIDNISIDPKEWPRPPVNSMFYAWLYRKLAIYSFTAKAWLGELIDGSPD